MLICGDDWLHRVIYITFHAAHGAAFIADMSSDNGFNSLKKYEQSSSQYVISDAT